MLICSVKFYLLELLQSCCNNLQEEIYIDFRNKEKMPDYIKRVRHII